MIPVDKIRQLPINYRFTIPESYLDEMGHMNIKWYMSLFNESILPFFDSFVEKDYFLSGKGGVFALKQHLIYLAEVRVGETVTIHNRLLGRSAKRLHFMQMMVNESANVLACTMEVLNSHVNLTTRRTSPYPPEITERLDIVLAQHRRLDWDVPLCGVIEP